MFQDGRCNTSPILPYYNVTIDSFEEIHSLRATSGHHYLVSGTFHPPIGVLFSFPSRYFYSIGLETYLELGVDASHIQTRYPTDPTREHSKILLKNIFTGLSPSTVLKFQIEFNLFNEAKSKSTHHISHKSLSGIQFVLYRFRSPLLTISQLLSFPPPTKMFQFSGFPILTDQHIKMY